MSMVEKKPPARVDLLDFSCLENNEDKDMFIEAIYNCSFQSSSMREQIYLISQITINGKSLSPKDIGVLFNKKRGTINSHIERAKREIIHGGPFANGRPPILDSYIMSRLRQKVVEDYENHIICTYSSLSEWLYEMFDITINSNTLGAIIRRDQMIKPIKGKPIERERLVASAEEIDRYYRDLTDMITDLPADLVANLDEMGYSEYSDTFAMKIVVPEWVNVGTIPMDRLKKRITILHCIFADGSYLTPLIVTPRKTIEKELYDIGLTPDKVMVCYQENGFVDSYSFLLWACNIFFPEIERRITAHKKKDPNFDRSAVLILDGLKQHFSDYFEDECFAFNVDLAVIPPHSSDQVQPLDLLLFSLSKRSISNIRKTEGLSPQTNDIIQLLSSIQSASTTYNIIKSFQRGGIITHFDGNLICSVDLERATKVRHYQNVVSRPRTYNKSRIDLTANARINQADTMMRSFEKQSVNPE